MTNAAGALLARAGLIGENELRRAQEARAAYGGTLAEQLVLLGLADDEALTGFYHSRLMVPRMDPNKLARIAKRVISKVPADMATEFRLIPVNFDREQNLTVVMSDPGDTHAIDEIGFFTGCYVMRAVATQRQIAWCLAHYYGYVSPLGETLLEAQEDAQAEAQAAPAEPAAQAAQRAPGPITRQVKESRHEVRPPVVAERPQPARPIVDEAPTGPMIQRPPTQEPNPPELASRAGEVEIRSDGHGSGEALPAVVIDAAVEEDPISTIEETDDDILLLDTPRSRRAEAASLAQAAPSDPVQDEPSDIVVLDTPRQPGRRRRSSKRTHLGLGVVAADTRERPQDSSPPDVIDEAGPGPALAIPVLRGPVASQETTQEAAGTEGAASARTSVTDGVPVAVSDSLEGEADATARYSRTKNYDEDEWDSDDPDESIAFGPPGTTIPPAFLGAMPDTEHTGPQNAIPLNLPEDQTGGLSAPTAPPADPITALASGLSEIADTQRDLEGASIRLVETLRALDNAHSRDAIVEALLDHLSMSFARATFFVVRGADLVPFRGKGIGATAANWKNSRLKVATPSTFRDVVQTRLPFRGKLPDEASQSFATKVFGIVPEEILLVPCTVRERPVGVVCGTNRTGRIFHEHLSVVTRGAGEAFERLIKKRKNTES